MNNPTIWETIADIPWWLYPTVTYLIIVGFTATKPRVVSVKHTFILPGLFLVLSVASLLYTVHASLTNIAFWLLAIVAGSGVGWLYCLSLKIKAVKDKPLLYLPGTWSVLFIFLTIFAVRSYYGFTLAFDPLILTQPKHAFALVTIYGLFTGLFIGRSVYSLRCLKVGPFITL